MKLKILAFAVALTLAINLSAQTFTVLHTFTGGNDGDSPYAGLILSGNTLYGTARDGGSSGHGTVFAVNTNGTRFTNLHSFTGSDGSLPLAGLILSGNTLYGTASGGGSSANGTVFAVNTDGTGFTNLYSFSGGSDGAIPYAGLILSGNTLYGTTINGGSSGVGTVFAVNTDGSGFTNLYSFASYPSGVWCPLGGLILSGDTLYGTVTYTVEANWSTLDEGAVFAVNTDGSDFNNLYNFTTPSGSYPSLTNSDGASPHASLILSGNTLYGTTQLGGANGKGTVFKVSTDGTGFTVLHTFTGGNDGGSPYAGLILSGNTLYGTTFSGGSGTGGTVFALNTDGTGFTTLHNFTWSSDGALPFAGLILSGNTLYGTAWSGGGSSGNGIVFALSLTPSAPIITTQPQSQTAQAGNNVTFTVNASDYPPPSYQWQFNGQNIANATNATLTLNSVTAANSGGYSVVVSNPYGSVTSATASLKLLADPANGNPTAQISPLYCPLPAANVDSLILVTHGVEPLYQINPWGDISWITTMANAIRAKAPSNWEVRTLDWTAVSQATEPDIVSLAGTVGGHLYGSQLGQQRNWKHIHLIAHSAGASVIEAIAAELKALPLANRPVIHETFLDPYLGSLHQLQSYFGSHSDWSDNYFAADVLSLWTNAKLPHAHNVDVSWLDTTDISYVTNYSSPSGMADTTPATIYEQQIPVGVQAYVFSSHGWPIAFYQASITNGPPNAAGYGFPLSEENGWNNFASYPTNNNPVVLNGQLAIYQNLAPTETGLQIPFSLRPNATSSSGVNFSGNSGATLFNTLSQSSFSPNGLGVHPLGGPTPTNVPAWLSVGLTITNPVNFVQFDAAFTDTNSAQGLLTVYWDTNQIGMVDERVASTNWQTYSFALPGTVTNNVYVLGFRLDSFNNTLASIAVTNVATGFVGVHQPVALGVALFTNSTPILQLTGASNYNYLVESSTNLVDWTPTALLVNSNGTVFFADKTATNTPARFYRALMP